MTITITRQRLNALIVAFLAVLLLAGCGASVPTSQQAEGAAQEGVSAQLVKNQPIPNPTYSQMRQNLIEIEQAQIDGRQSTTFFFNPNVREPYLVCPSVGAPIPGTASLSNPEQIAIRNYGNSNYANGTIQQMDPNGVYVGQSTGTWALCIQPNGKVVATYSEGYAHVEFAPAHWDNAVGIVVDGAPSAVFTKSKGH